MAGLSPSHVRGSHKNIWKAVSGNTVGSEELLSKRFQSDWENIDHDLNDVTLSQWLGTTDDIGKPITSMIASTATEVLKWVEECYSTSVFPRADYKELLELTIFFLGGDVTFKLRKPGALHHARFMSKAIYFLKMCLLSTRLELTDKELDQITRMANFIALFYAKSFLRSRLALIAPTDDLLFLGSMIWFREDDEVIANSAIESCLRHQWYFTEALVVFAIFKEKLSEFTRSILARKLWETPRPKEFIVGKPKFPIEYQWRP